MPDAESFDEGKTTGGILDIQTTTVGSTNTEKNDDETTVTVK